jgi:hypothetical protein
MGIEVKGRPSPLDYRLVKVTPSLAGKWLEAGKGIQRNLMSSYVTALAAQMRRGEWKSSTHQSIAITAEGRILDGQHRLAAVVMADLTVEMLVAFNADPNTFDVVDGGRPRTAANILQIMGIQNAAVISAAAKFVLSYDKVKGIWSGPAYQAELSKPMIGQFAMENADGFAEALKVSGPVRRVLHLKPAGLLAVAFMILRKERDAGVMREEFFQGLLTGEELHRGDPRLAVRKMYGTSRLDKRTDAAQYQMAVLLKAWNAFVQGDPVQLLRWLPSEKMPNVRAAIRRSVAA